MEKKIKGKLLAKAIFNQLKKKVKTLRKKRKTPYLAVFSAGDDAASNSYIRQKRKAALQIGTKLKHFKFKKETSYQQFAEALNSACKDPKFSGVIIQKPLPVSLAHSSLDSIIPLKKDIDGTRIKSPFIPPVAMATLRILDYIRTQGQVVKVARRKVLPPEGFTNWLSHHSILLIGRGETAGKPIAKTFSELRVRFLIVHRETENLPLFLKKADIVVSCVGKEIVKKEMLKSGAILIGVGIRRVKKGVFRGDFNERDIEDIVSFYTPTPGGIGPLTVACLMENLVDATEKNEIPPLP